MSPIPLSPLLLFNLLATKTSPYRSTPKPSIRYTIVSSHTGLHTALFPIVKELFHGSGPNSGVSMPSYSLILSPTLDSTFLNPKPSNRRKISIVVWNAKHYSLISTLQLVSSFTFGVTISGTLCGHICTNVQPHTPRCHHYPAYKA